MAGFFNRLRLPSTGGPGSSSNASASKKKDEPSQELTPLEKMLQNAGPIRENGSDKFFGLENFGNTCYCNSIVQALYYSESFRENVVNYPPFTPSDTPNGKPAKINVQIRPPMNGAADQNAQGKKGLTSSQAMRQRQAINGGMGPAPGQPQRPEDKPDSPEYKKKQAMMKGPVLDLAEENSAAYNMEESTFTGLKDLFKALIESSSRTGVLSPQRFLEIFKRDNEMFRNSMHQDAHEFYGLVLNDVIANVEANARRMLEQAESKAKDDLARSLENALGATTLAAMRNQSGARSPGTGWVHDIFEGLLTSETKCLTCETTSQRDETFLDLSIDLEEHSSVTSCLQKFSAEEMLCERNKFHCDHCGGLQEAEKRMKLKRLPRVLALHLKRFKYTEDYSRLQKLFHRVVYPYHLRMFNTTDDAEDPDRLYELYAVVVHIGGNAYHGHYVSVIKTPEWGWLLFDDEMVEPVDKHFVRNFFGDKPGMACAYVLFYQETTLEKVMAEQDADGVDDIMMAAPVVEPGVEKTNGAASVANHISTPISPTEEPLRHASTELNGSTPQPITLLTNPLITAVPPAPAVASPSTGKQSKEEKEREKKEQKAQEKEAKAQEKARKAAEKEQAKQRKEEEARLREARKVEEDDLKKVLKDSKKTAAQDEERLKREEKETAVANNNDSSTALLSSSPGGGFLNRSLTVGAKSMTRKSFGFLNKDKDKDKSKDKEKNGEAIKPIAEHADSSSTPNGSLPSPHPDGHPKLKERFSFGLGKKSSKNVLP